MEAAALTLGQDAIAARETLARQVPAFLLVGATGFLVDAGLTVLIAAGLGFSPYVARPPAVVAATIATFLLNRAFTFRRAGGHWPSEFLRYAVVAASGQALNYAVYAGALTVAGLLGLHQSPLVIALSVAWGSGAAMFLTFAGFRSFAFRV
jgi:putative flippase GtrA